MCKDHRSRIVLNADPQNFTGMDAGAVDSAKKHLLCGDQMMMVIEEQTGKYFCLTTSQPTG